MSSPRRTRIVAAVSPAVRVLMLGVALLCAAAPRAGAGEMTMGVNVSAVDYWGTQWVFVDAFRQASEWIPQRLDGGAWNTGEPLALSRDGWVKSLAPGQVAATLMFRDTGGHYPAGDYVCLYRGKGRIQVDGDARAFGQRPGRLVVKVSPTDAGILLKIVATDPADPVRDIRLIMPGFEDVYEREPFHPLFLSRLKGFRVIRFMDFGRTNTQTVERWSDRVTTATYTQAAAGGTAIEYMIALSNAVEADPWFCMPHRADDDYVRQFAALVKKDLHPGRRIYIEYSNEVWNDQFAQATYATKQGRLRFLALEKSKAKLFFYSRRSVEIFRLWESAFGSHDRFVRVLGAQFAWPLVGALVMDHDEAWRHADALAVAPYFDAGVEAGALAGMSRDQILDACAATLKRDQARLVENLANAKRRGLRLIAYEGGQGLVAGDQEKLTAVLLDCNRSPRMEKLYAAHLNDWKETVGDLFVHYANVGRYSRWGSWGLLEFQDQDPDSAPKFRAVRTFMGASPPRPPEPQSH